MARPVLHRLVRRTSSGTLYWDNVRKVWTDDRRHASRFRRYPTDLPDGVGCHGDFLPIPTAPRKPPRELPKGAQHSPGPWRFVPCAGHHDFSIYSEAESSGRDLALVRDFNRHNARVMALSPEMLASLRTLVDWEDDPPRTRYEARDRRESFRVARDVIRRAMAD